MRKRQLFNTTNKVYSYCRWFGKWNIKIASEKEQRNQKKEMIGENLECEFLPLEHTEKKGNKTVTTIRETACTYVKDLTEKVVSFVEQNSK